MKISKIKTTSLYKKIAFYFFAFTIVILSLAIYFSLSKTVITIRLNPKPQTVKLSVDITSQPVNEITENNLTGVIISTNVSGKINYEIKGYGEQKKFPATGTVTIYNHWSKTQPLAATTRLLTPEGILFRIKNRVDVPAGGKVENVEVYADQPGELGNIGPSKFTIPGLWAGLQDKIYAESFQPMTGGVKQIKTVTQESIKQANQQLRLSLLKEAKAKLETENADILKDQELKQEELAYTTINNEISAQIGDEVSSFDDSLTLKVVGTVFNHDDLYKIALTAFNKELPKNFKLSSSGQTKLTYTIKNFDLDNQTANLNVKFTANIIPRLSHPMFKRDKITGLDKQEIKSYFSNFDSVKSVNIKFSPFWVNKTPSLKDHIEIILK